MKFRSYNILTTLLLVFFLLPKLLLAQDLPLSLPELGFHLTYNKWEPKQTPKSAYLKAVEGICQVARQHQNDEGAIIDPYLNREHQYSTPYYAFAVGTLLSAGMADDLRASGIAAMDHATKDFAEGSQAIPDAHGEFYIAALSGALALYQEYVDQRTYQKWEARLGTPLSTVMSNFSGRLNNWRTYAMKGEWMRAHQELADRQETIQFIEKAWHHWTQRERIVLDKWNLYQDWSSDPQSHAVEAVGRGNLVGLMLEGYDGPSSDEIWQSVRKGSQTSLLLQSPVGQSPPNGRTDNHVFNDILYQLIFEAMAVDAHAQGNERLAGQYRRAAMLAFESIQRWQRTDAPWEGSFYITKNFFEPGARIGYQPASQWGNYSGAMMFHLAEAYLTALEEIEEEPAPTEIGGFAFSTDERFSSFVANAGGMQVFVNLRGAAVPKYGLSWTPLGAVRFSRSGWDDRLGPSDGKHQRKQLSAEDEQLVLQNPYNTDGRGISFAPSWKKDSLWIRMADLPEHYRATPIVHFVHPLLVRFSLTYHYATGAGGPYFRQDFVITPRGILSQLHSLDDIEFGITVPLLQNDGRDLVTHVSNNMLSTGYPGASDEQYFISLNQDVQIESGGSALQSTYGWLQPYRYLTQADTNTVFIYPKKDGEARAEEVMNSFQFTKSGFQSVLGRVEDKLYIDQYAAGGEGKAVDLDGDGTEDVRFSKSCQFMLKLDNGSISQVEADKDVEMYWQERTIPLRAFTPISLH